jgi:hypothetical protein
MGNQCSSCSLTEDELNEVKVEPKFEGEATGATEAKTKTKTTTATAPGPKQQSKSQGPLTEEKKEKEAATAGRRQNPAAANLLDAHPSGRGKAADAKDEKKGEEEETGPKAPPPAATAEPGPRSRKAPPCQSGDKEVPHDGEPEVSGAAPSSSAAGAAFGDDQPLQPCGDLLCRGHFGTEGGDRLKELHTSLLSDEAPPAPCASAPPAPCASAPPPAPAEAEPPTAAAPDEEVEVDGAKGDFDVGMDVVDLPKNLGPMVANEESAVEDLICPDAAKAFGAMEEIASPAAKPSATPAGCTVGPWCTKPSVGSWLMVRTSPQVSMKPGRCEDEASTYISKDVPALDAKELDVADILPIACKDDEDQESFVATSLEVNVLPTACKIDEDQESFVAAPLEADFDPMSESSLSPKELDSAKVAPEAAATEVALEPELDSILEAKLDQSVFLSASDAPNTQDSDALKDLALLEEEFAVVKDAHAGM